MACWYRVRPKRFQTEIFTLEKATNAKPKWIGTTLVADEDVRIGSYAFGLRFVFPDDFPNEAPTVFLRYPELPLIVELHRYSDGSLCLAHADDWSPRRTMLWMRSRAVVWCHCVVAYMKTGRFAQPTRPGFG